MAEQQYIVKASDDTFFAGHSIQGSIPQFETDVAEAAQVNLEEAEHLIEAGVGIEKIAVDN